MHTQTHTKAHTGAYLYIKILYLAKYLLLAHKKINYTISMDLGDFWQFSRLFSQNVTKCFYRVIKNNEITQSQQWNIFLILSSIPPFVFNFLPVFLIFPFACLISNWLFIIFLFAYSSLLFHFFSYTLFRPHLHTYTHTHTRYASFNRIKSRNKF